MSQSRATFSRYQRQASKQGLQQALGEAEAERIEGEQEQARLDAMHAETNDSYERSLLREFDFFDPWDDEPEDDLLEFHDPGPDDEPEDDPLDGLSWWADDDRPSDFYDRY